MSFPVVFPTSEEAAGKIARAFSLRVFIILSSVLTVLLVGIGIAIGSTADILRLAAGNALLAVGAIAAGLVLGYYRNSTRFAKMQYAFYPDYVAHEFKSEAEAGQIRFATGKERGGRTFEQRIPYANINWIKVTEKKITIRANNYNAYNANGQIDIPAAVDRYADIVQVLRLTAGAKIRQ